HWQSPPAQLAISASSLRRRVANVHRCSRWSKQSMKQESKSHHVQRAIRRVLISASGAVAVAAAPQLHAQDPTIQEVVVTGSRIPQPNITSIRPLHSLWRGTREDEHTN